MKPDEAENLDDHLWDGMVRHMQKEAEAIRQANAKLRKPR